MKNAYALGCIVALACSGLTLGACSSSNSDPGPGVAADSGKADTGGGGTDTGGGGTDTGGGGTDTGGGGTDTAGGGDTSGGGDTGSEAGTCGKDPTLHVPVAGSGPYCPGYKPDGGTASASCAAGEFCCETKTTSGTPSNCAASASACATGIEAVWACDAPSMCGAGMVCCGDGTPKIKTGCTYEEIFPAKGTVCAAACTATQVTVCEADADCPTGKTCTPIKTGGKQVGYCK